MSNRDDANALPNEFDDWENEGDATRRPKSFPEERFALFERSNGSKVACRVASIQFLATGENGSVLHFGGSTQVNVSQSFDEVLALLNSGQ